MLGELLQNNHHRFPQRPNFAVAPGELDPTWPLIQLLERVGVLRLRPRSRMAVAGPAADAAITRTAGNAGGVA